jgi:hypothetical protein
VLWIGRRIINSGERNAAIGSAEGDLRRAGDFSMEPVCSSLAGACFPLVPIFRAANRPNTRIDAATTLNATRRLALSHGKTKFRIGIYPFRSWPAWE